MEAPPINSIFENPRTIKSVCQQPRKSTCLVRNKEFVRLIAATYSGHWYSGYGRVTDVFHLLLLLLRVGYWCGMVLIPSPKECISLTLTKCWNYSHCRELANSFCQKQQQQQLPKSSRKNKKEKERTAINYNLRNMTHLLPVLLEIQWLKCFSVYRLLARSVRPSVRLSAIIEVGRGEKLNVTNLTLA